VANPFRAIRKELKARRRLARRRVYLTEQEEGDIVGRFHTLFYDSHIFHETHRNCSWLGTPLVKCPFDLWVYQELIHELKPDLIVECGTQSGGSALFFSSMCDLMGKGEVITIDIAPLDGRPQHPRLTYLTGSSVSEDIVEQVRAAAAGKGVVLVALDSNHEMDHVLREMQLYGPLVTPGSYMIVEDGNLNGHPVVPDFGPGPGEAIQAYFKENDDFEIDLDREKFFVTFNPNGYLRKRD
jgi:cephalosporin hydroxylase